MGQFSGLLIFFLNARRYGEECINKHFCAFYINILLRLGRVHDTLNIMQSLLFAADAAKCAE